MGMTLDYRENAPDHSVVAQWRGPTLLEFGTGWCGHCAVLQPLLAEVIADYPEVRHLKIEDGTGRPLGRAFRVKLWPTLVFLRDGEEVARLVRPSEASAIAEAFAKAL